MALGSWGKGLSKLFKKDVPAAEVERPERYLKRARRCMENVESMSSRSASSSLQFHLGQCQYLSNKLGEALFAAEMSSALASSSTIDVQGVEIMKLLWRCAKGVESFIQGCRKNNWVQAAMVFANTIEHVCQLSADLEFCRLFFHNKCNEYKNAWRTLDAIEDNFLDISEKVKDIVSRDQKALLTRLETVNPSSNSSEEETQLAQCLASRLSQHLSGLFELGCWEIQFSSLNPGQRLGSGSAGVTVRKSKWMGEEVAEKVFQGADHASFRNEVQILAGLAHPNIVPLIGYAADGNRCIIVMELMDCDLSSLMEDRLRHNHTLKVPFSDCEAVNVMLQTAEGVRYLHENKVVHRDLKALNILVKRRKDIDGEDVVYVKVADFGLSKTKESSSSYSNLTANTGTRRWMAPELLTAREDDFGARTSYEDSKLRHPFKVDVYSFGMVCYEILTGEVPFSSISSLIEVRKMVLTGQRPELPKQCPKSLKQLIRSCWETDANRRPSFVEICRRLRCLKYLMVLCTDGSIRTSNPGLYVERRTLELPIKFGYKRFPVRNYRISKIELPQVGQSFSSRGFIAFEVSSGVQVAIKRIEKEQLIGDPQGVEDVKREVEIMQELGRQFENIVEFYEAFEDDDHAYIVMELCEGGNLSDRIKAKGHYPEKDAAKIVRQMLKAIEGCHMRGAVHRYIQPENLLFKSLEEDSSLKATGFHFSNYNMQDERSHDIVQMNTAYMAPEALEGFFVPKSDMWSIGVVTYILLCGVHPFRAYTEHRLRNEIKMNKLDLRWEPWPSIALSAKDFMMRLLVTNHFDRPTATQALRHPWVSDDQDDGQRQFMFTSLYPAGFDQYYT